MASRPQIQDELSRRLRLATSSHFSVPKERVTHSDRIEALLDERLKQKKRIEKLEEELREYEIEETIYKSKDKPDLGDPFR